MSRFLTRNFRGTFVSAAILALYIAASPAVWSQQTAMNCTATAPNAPTVRQEGVTELIGDLVVQCTGGTPVTTGPFPQFNFTVQVSSFITSRILSTASALPLTEALLTIDDPATEKQAPCVTTLCNNTDNVFQGLQASILSLQWLGVPVNPPGPNATRTIRFKNIRVNATLLPVNSSVFSTIGINSATGAPTPILNGSQLTAAVVRSGVSVDLRSITDSAQTVSPALVACTGNNIDLSGANTAAYSTPGGRTFQIRFSEGFSNAWKKRNAGTTINTPTQVSNQDGIGVAYNTESGLYNANFPTTNGLSRAGLADSGTRLRAVFTNVPANAKIFVTTSEVNPGTTLVGATPSVRARLTSTTPSFSGLTGESTADGGLKLLGPGTYEATWEILETDSAQQEVVSFGVVVAFSSNPQPGSGTASVASGFGTQSISFGATTTDAIPRFNASAAPLTAFTLTTCRTTMLFQFVTNTAGFDTGLSISNTSKDTLGTLAQAGKCTATFFPTPVNTAAQYPALITPNSLQAGEQWTFTVSNVRPGFQGYMMVGCDFQFAHGYAFVSDFGARNLAQGYQALIIPDRARVADPMTTSLAGSGEQLVQ